MQARRRFFGERVNRFEKDLSSLAEQIPVSSEIVGACRAVSLAAKILDPESDTSDLADEASSIQTKDVKKGYTVNFMIYIA
jgi:hypothetical protein